VGKRSRQRAREAGPQAGHLEPLQAPTTVYPHGEDGALELRGSMSPRARVEYAAVLSGGLNQEDAWQRATELLFERLAVSWTIAGLHIARQQELLRRYRAATQEERRFVRDSLRTHLRENFPDLQAP
jgi:hypothetical protein